MLTLAGVSDAQDPAAPGFAWSDEIEALISAGDPGNGKQLTEKCDNCHGADGVSDPENGDIPNLAGQYPAYLFKQLKDYQSSMREHRIMQRRARKLSDPDMADLVAWYASVPARAGDDPPDEAPVIVVSGDPARRIPPCRVCHGDDGAGVAPLIPRIAGQRAEYMTLTLLDIRDGLRRGVDESLRVAAKALSDEEVHQVAEYYSRL